jgi:hypothetical protein
VASGADVTRRRRTPKQTGNIAHMKFASAWKRNERKHCRDEGTRNCAERCEKGGDLELEIRMERVVHQVRTMTKP